MTRARERRPARTAPVVLLALVVAACGEPSLRAADAPPLRVFAAASLTAAFEELADAFEAAHPDTRVELHLAGTPTLVLQLREGAPADVLAAADEPNLQRVLALDLAAGAPRAFASNGLAIVTPPGNPAGITGLEDFAREELVLLLCAPDVPAGRYARAALASAGVVPRPDSDEPSVKAVLHKLRLGEADAGIVYVTDARAAGDAVHALPVPPEHDVRARYPLVVLRAGARPDAATAFAELVLAQQGRAILAAHGFGPP